MENLVGKESGFFKEKHYAFRKNISQAQLDAFSELKSDEERFRFVYEIPEAHSYKIYLSSNEKCVSSAKVLKDEGNKAFKNGDYKTALKFYTKSLMKCPTTIDERAEMGIIRANRSAAFYHLNEYKLACQDIDAALGLDYPKNLSYKIKDRKARCFLAMKQHKSAISLFRETLVALDDANINLERRKKWQMDVQIMIAMLLKANAENEEVPSANSKTDDISETHKMYKSAHKSVMIQESEESGRWACAGEGIETGTTVVAEEAHAAVLSQERSLTHCFQCFRRCGGGGEECPGCSKVLFCSIACRSAALASHHAVECPILELLWASGASITCLIALRIISQQPPAYFSNLTLGTELEGDYSGRDYRRVHGLVSHTQRRTPEDLLHRTHMAVFLFRALRAAHYFQATGEKGGDEDISSRGELDSLMLRVGGLLLHHLQLLQFNAHEVSELEIPPGGNLSLSSVKSVFIGAALYPTLALFNHSCNPAITRYFVGTKVIAKTIRPLEKGEMIGENYGPLFTRSERTERRRTLESQYWFHCECEACSGNWPTLEEMNTDIFRFRCPSRCPEPLNVPLDTLELMVKCPQCSRFINVLKGLKTLQDSESTFRIGTALMEEGHVNEALKKFIELLNLLGETLVPPFKDYHLCQQAIRTCFLAKGNKYSG